MVHEAKSEVIIRQHRHWTHRVESLRVVGQGNLVLTNRRLLFLHKIEASPEVGASIKKLADAPIETVLDHALTLHKGCLQIPLASIARVGIGAVSGFPFPHFCLTVSYYEGKKRNPRVVAFQFKRPKSVVFQSPQIISDIRWRKAILRAMKG